jgi:hypothetical protein
MLKKNHILFKLFLWKYDIDPSFWVHPIQQAQAMSDHAFFD